jgi:hypothetical protein
MFGYGKKIVTFEDQKEERSVVVAVVGMDKGRSNCYWGSIRLLKHILQIMQIKGPLL